MANVKYKDLKKLKQNDRIEYLLLSNQPDASDLAILFAYFSLVLSAIFRVGFELTNDLDFLSPLIICLVFVMIFTVTSIFLLIGEYKQMKRLNKEFFDFPEPKPKR